MRKMLFIMAVLVAFAFSKQTYDTKCSILVANGQSVTYRCTNGMDVTLVFASDVKIPTKVFYDSKTGFFDQDTESKLKVNANKR